MARCTALALGTVILATSVHAQSRNLRAKAEDRETPFVHPAPLTESHCRRSRVVWGDIEGASRFADKLGTTCDGGSLNIVIFGGSVTHGSNNFDPELPEEDPSHALLTESKCWANRRALDVSSSCSDLRYGSVLERRLNAAYPCGNGDRHRVHLKPKKGHGTEFHLQILRDCEAFATGARQPTKHETALVETCAQVHAADIVMVDTAMNDHFDTALKAESMVLQLAKLPNEPAVYFFVAGLFEHDWESHHAKPRYFTDTQGEEQAGMLEYYGVSQISLQKAIMADLGRRDGRDRWLPLWSFDGRHPSAWGHTVLADLLLWNLRRDIADLRSTSASLLNQAGLLKQLPDAWLVDPQDDFLRFVPAALTEAGVVNAVAVAGEGFALAEDVPSKPGLIASEPGSFVVLQPLPDQTAHSKCEFLLTYLVSYEHMGTMTVEVLLEKEPAATPLGADTGTATSLACGYRGEESDLDVAYTDHIDTQITGNVRESVAHEYRVPFAVPPGHECAWLRVTVASEGAGRTENKIKLLGLTTACPVASVILH